MAFTKRERKAHQKRYNDFLMKIYFQFQTGNSYEKDSVNDQEQREENRMGSPTQ